jgi:hypothetical protein
MDLQNKTRYPVIFSKSVVSEGIRQLTGLRPSRYFFYTTHIITGRMTFAKIVNNANEYLWTSESSILPLYHISLISPNHIAPTLSQFVYK